MQGIINKIAGAIIIIIQILMIIFFFAIAVSPFFFIVYAIITGEWAIIIVALVMIALEILLLSDRV